MSQPILTPSRSELATRAARAAQKSDAELMSVLHGEVVAGRADILQKSIGDFACTITIVPRRER